MVVSLKMYTQMLLRRGAAHLHETQVRRKLTCTYPTRTLRLQRWEGKNVLTRAAADAVRWVPSRGWRRGRGLARTLTAENVTQGTTDGQHHVVRRFPQHFQGLLKQEMRYIKAQHVAVRITFRCCQLSYNTAKRKRKAFAVVLT